MDTQLSHAGELKTLRNELSAYEHTHEPRKSSAIDQA